MKQITIITSLIIVLVGMTFLSAFLALKGGIKWNSPETTTHNHNENFQGQLMVNMMMQRGNKLRWKIKTCKETECVIDFLNTLHPTSSYFAKIDVERYPRTIIYPDFLDKKK